MKKNSKFESVIYKLLGKLVKDISKNVLTYTPQLYYIEKESRDTVPKPIATSILYTSGVNYYLITEKHAFNHEEEWEIGILIRNIFYSLEGIKYSSDDNNIDLVVYHLTDRLKDTLKPYYQFLNLNQIDTNHLFIKERYTRYLQAGFPINRTSLKKHTKTISVNPFILLSDIYTTTNEHAYINLPKIKKSFLNNIPIRTLPVLTGLSGSGLWYISNFYNKKFKLVGIMIEWDDIDKKYTKATKISFVINLIKTIETKIIS